MEIKAKVSNIRMSPRKVRLVAGVVRGLSLADAIDKLPLVNKRAALPMKKLLLSALANAEHNLGLKKENLLIKEVYVDSGATLHRWTPRAFGRATPIRKRTSVITVVLTEKVPTEVKAKKGNKIDTVEATEAKGDAPAEKIDMKKSAGKEADEEKKGEIFDVTHKGGFRDEHQRPKLVKKEKGVFKKMFRRKAGM
ncbi:MAG: 50S ribosomal protein L22 [Parcubacteria group bacterium]